MSSAMTVQHKSELRESAYSMQLGNSPPIADFFKAISDDKALTIFNTVALNAGKTGILISTLGITRKQFYSKMERFTKQGLLGRRDGRYYLTTLGKIMYELQSTFGLALNNYWKLKAIDSLETPGGLPEFEVNKLIDSLLESPVLKNLILSKVK
jgi:predicted transcriptional regulator